MAAKIYNPTHTLAYCASYDPKSANCQKCECQYTDIEESLILQECDAFYDVFLQIEKRLRNCGITENSAAKKQPILLSAPMCINGAFACELALKYLLISANMPFNMSSGHNLEYLFNLLPQDKRDTLITFMEKEYNNEQGCFQSGLSAIANTFNDRRYNFSKFSSNRSLSSFFRPFVHTICRYVLELS